MGQKDRTGLLPALERLHRGFWLLQMHGARRLSIAGMALGAFLLVYGLVTWDRHILFPGCFALLHGFVCHAVSRFFLKRLEP